MATCERRGNRPVDGGGDQRVEELQTVVFGSVRSCIGEDAGLAQPGDGVGGLGLAQSSDARGQAPGCLGAQHGGTPGEPDGGGAEPLQPLREPATLHRGGELPQFGNVYGLRLQPAIGDLGDQFDGLERVPSGDRPGLAAERLIGFLTQSFPDDAADPAGGERYEVEGARSKALGQPAERHRIDGEFIGAVGHDEQHREFGDPRREAGEPGQRLGVGPVGVVQHHHQRRVLHGEAGGDPVQAVPHALRIGGGVAVPRHQAH
jgi:hypothetical protein